MESRSKHRSEKSAGRNDKNAASTSRKHPDQSRTKSGKDSREGSMGGKHKNKCSDGVYEHQIQLQIADIYGIPVEDTGFWVKLTIIKHGPEVTIYFPLVNFVTGPLSAISPPLPPPRGGYIMTGDGFLPEQFRPYNLVSPSTVVAANDGMSTVFSFTEPLPEPITGYILSVSNSGAVSIQGAGTFGNAIPSGPHIMKPCSISYIVAKKVRQLCSNQIISNGFTDTTAFTSNIDELRDSHVNDAYDNRIAWAWVDNSMLVDKSSQALNVMVVTGINENGQLKLRPPVQLTDFAEITVDGSTGPTYAWNSAAASINRYNPDTVVVSYTINYILGSCPCRAVSLDGGKTWPPMNTLILFKGQIVGNILTVEEIYNGQLDVGLFLYTTRDTGPQPLGEIGIDPQTYITKFLTGTGGVGQYEVNIEQNSAEAYIVASLPLNGQVPVAPMNSRATGDNRGVLADTYGNVWYSCKPTYMVENHFIVRVGLPLFAVSPDGITFHPYYTVPLPNSDEYPLGSFFYDSPEICLGNDENGQYGLWFRVTFIDMNTQDNWPAVGFIPIPGHITDNSTATNVQFTWLRGLTNTMVSQSITASSKGQVWFAGENAFNFSNMAEQPLTVMAKSPGPIDSNYTGSWNCGTFNGLQLDYSSSAVPIPPPWGVISQKHRGYFPSPQSIIYDEPRKVLYLINSFRTPEYGQNMRITFSISRNNGQTWSEPININTTNFANRGFQTMALDRKTGCLYLGWYDGRNDPEYKKVEYFIAMISSKCLDQLLEDIPVSEVVYQTGSSANRLPQVTAVTLGGKPNYNQEFPWRVLHGQEMKQA